MSADIRAITEALDESPAEIDPRWAELIPVADTSSWGECAAPDRQWILEGWLPLGQATYLTGPGSAGKSLLAQQLCTCVALGVPFMGIPTRRTRAMYISCEDDVDELRRRQEAICKSLDEPIGDLGDDLHLVSLAGHIGAELATFQTSAGPGEEQPIIRPSSRFRALEGTAIAKNVGFIALDNVAHFFAGNENIRVEVAAFIGLLNQLALHTSGAVLLIGHPNKAGQSFSGSTAWENQVRSRLFLEVAKSDEQVLDPDLRVLRREKSNYARNGAELTFRWYEWAYTRDEDLPDGMAERLADTAQASGDNEIFLACLAERNRQRRPVSERYSRSYAPTVFAAMPESKRIGKKRLEAAMERLFRLEIIERAVLGRDSSKGRDIEGLRLTE